MENIIFFSFLLLIIFFELRKVIKNKIVKEAIFYSSFLFMSLIIYVFKMLKL